MPERRFCKVATVKNVLRKQSQLEEITSAESWQSPTFLLAASDHRRNMTAFDFKRRSEAHEAYIDLQKWKHYQSAVVKVAHCKWQLRATNWYRSDHWRQNISDPPFFSWGEKSVTERRRWHANTLEAVLFPDSLAREKIRRASKHFWGNPILTCSLETAREV